MLRTLWFFALFLPWTLLCIIAGLPFSFFSPDYFHTVARVWARLGLWLAGVRVKVEGREHLPEAGAVLYMANHASNFDIPALYVALPGQFRWLAKKELFAIPLFGLAMRRSGYIPIDRGDRRSAMLSMQAAAARIAAGASVIMFPEGTRSRDGLLQPFKKGGGILAHQAGVPVVPVAILGSQRVMRKYSRWIEGGTIRVRIFPPLSDPKALPREALLEEVYRTLAAAIAEDVGAHG